MSASKHKISAIEQALLDLKAVGASTPEIDALFKEFKDNPKILKKANELWNKHQYPDTTITWCRLFTDNELEKIISPSSYVTFIALIKTMKNATNKIQLSLKDIITITGLNKKTIIKSISELKNLALVAIYDIGNAKSPSIYMINPRFATKGKCNPKKLEAEFWELVTEDAENNYISTFAKVRSYQIGTRKLEIQGKQVSFSTIEEPKKQKNKPSDTPSDDLPDSDIPF